MKIKLLLKIFLIISSLFVSTTCDSVCGLGFSKCPGIDECCPSPSPYYCKTDDNCYLTRSEAAQHCPNQSNIIFCD